MSSGIKGTFALTKNIFVEWQSFASFSEAITGACEILALRTDLSVEVDSELLKIVHSTWLKSVAEWVTHLMPQGTTVLSPLKQSAILMDKLCEHLPITVAQGTSVPRPVDNPQDGAGPPTGLKVLPDHLVQRYADGGCHFIAWQICFHICDFFESRRLDRLDVYELRMTDEFELDMVSSLISGRMTDVSIWMVLEALFLRD